MKVRLSSRAACATCCCLAAASAAMAQDASLSHIERELLGDAAVRASYQASATGGHDGRFFVASADGQTRLNVGALLQYRYNVNLRDADDPDEDLTNGFDFRRAKLFVSGRVRPEIEFYIQGAFFCGDGDFRLEFAEATHRFENGMGITWGQFKLPFLHEELVSEKLLLAADRSVTHAVFTAGVSQGAQLWYEADSFRILGAVSDGITRCNTTYYDPTEADIALTGRAEIRFGEAPWSAYTAFSSFRGDPAGGLLGAAVHWQTSGETGNTLTFAGMDSPDIEVLSYTADATWFGGGWTLYGALIGRSTDPDAGADADDFGAIVQGSAFATEKLELFARWDAVFPDDDWDEGGDFNTLTLGANYYFLPGSYAARLTTDLQWFFDSQADSASLVAAPAAGGLLPSAEDDQLYLRVQMQLLF